MNPVSNIREGTLVYHDVTYGDRFITGHLALVRGPTTIGNNVLIGSGTIIEGECKLGNNVRIQSGVYIPKGVIIGDNVFIGPRVVFTNDKYPPSDNLKITYVKDNVVIGAASVILPGLKLGEWCFVAAGALVTKNVPPCKMAIGAPAKIVDMPGNMKVRS